MQILKINNEYVLDFPFRPKIVDAVKQLPNKRFDWANKRWCIPMSELENLKVFAKKYGFAWNLNDEPAQDFTINPLPELGIEIPLKRQLYPYQAQGVQYAYDKKRVIIGDKPGLGKTGQAIAAVTAHNAFPCLCITPPSPVLENWVDEWNLWTNKKAVVITPEVIRYMKQWIEMDIFQVFVINYESLKKYFVESIDRKEDGSFTLRNVKFKPIIEIFKSVICDESHRLKEFSSQRTKFVKGIASGKEFIYLLSGTAMVNKPQDLLPQLGIIDQLNTLGGYAFFKKRFCAGQKQASNLRELNKLLTDNCFYSRNKEDVLTDLPDKVRNIVYCDLDPETRILYDAAANNLEAYLKEYKQADDESIQRSMRGEVMVRIGILKNLSAKGKLAQVREYINTTIESEKLGVFMLQHDIVDEMKRHYPDALTITGRDSKEERVANKEKFQSDPDAKLIFLGLKTANEGITLTAASHCGFVELPWHAAGADQCEDRFHRIGQKDSVMCTYFLGRDTIDTWAYFDVIDAKRKMSNDVLGGNEDAVETNLVNSFIQFMDEHKNKKQVA